MSQLTRELQKLDFCCGIELVIYIRDTGKYTSLIIEGEHKGGDVLYRYDFYKQTFYPHSQNKVTIYGKKLTAPVLLRRVRKYLLHREKYLAKCRTI